MIDWVKIAGFIVGRIKARAAAFRVAGEKYESSQVALETAAFLQGEKALESRKEAARLQRVAQKLDGILK